VIEAARSTLRSEDALVRLDERSALLLCVAAPPEHAEKVIARIEKIAREKFAADDLELERSCSELTPDLLDGPEWGLGGSR
jgi:hypothetical protein